MRVTALRRPPLDATYELLELQRKVLADGVRERTAAADKALRRSAEDSKGTWSRLHGHAHRWEQCALLGSDGGWDVVPAKLRCTSCLLEACPSCLP